MELYIKTLSNVLCENICVNVLLLFFFQKIWLLFPQHLDIHLLVLHQGTENGLLN